MGIEYSFKDIAGSFNSVREEIINFSFLALSIIVGPLYIYGLYYQGGGLSLMSIANTLILLSIALVVSKCISIAVVFKKWLLLIILLYGNLYSIYNLGFFGGSQYFMILIFGLTFFYFHKWLALFINVSVLVYFFIFMFLYTSEKIEYYSAPSQLVTSKMIWLSDFLLSILVVVIGGYAIFKTFRAYSHMVKEHVDSLEKFNYTLENLPIPVAALQKDKQIPYFNSQFYNYFGYKAEEIPDFDHWLKYAYPDEKLRAKIGDETGEIMTKAFQNQSQLPLEYHDFRTKSGEVKSAEVHHTFFGDTAICAFVDLTERMKKRRLIIETMMQAEEKENKRIAQDLHDGIGPLLSTAKIYAHSIVSDCSCDDNSCYAAKLKDLLDASIKELRNTITNVSPQILQQYGLVSAIDSFVNHIKAATSINFVVVAKPMSINSPLIELAVYRALLELINNSIKYAQAEQVNIIIENQSEALIVNYKDNGIGFDFENEKRNGFGLSNIVNRVETVGGQFNLLTSPGNGVDVTISFDR